MPGSLPPWITNLDGLPDEQYYAIINDPRIMAAFAEAMGGGDGPADASDGLPGASGADTARDYRAGQTAQAHADASSTPAQPAAPAAQPPATGSKNWWENDPAPADDYANNGGAGWGGAGNRAMYDNWYNGEIKNFDAETQKGMEDAFMQGGVEGQARFNDLKRQGRQRQRNRIHEQELLPGAPSGEQDAPSQKGSGFSSGPADTPTLGSGWGGVPGAYGPRNGMSGDKAQGAGGFKAGVPARFGTMPSTGKRPSGSGFQGTRSNEHGLQRAAPDNAYTTPKNPARDIWQEALKQRKK